MNFDLFFEKLGHKISKKSADAVLALTADGATVPFIARYRKEQTGNLDETQIRTVIEQKEKFDEIIKRQAFIASEIEKQGKLSDELKAKISGAFDIDLLEDIYLPFKQKRKTKAAIAKEQGLEPLADLAIEVARGLSPFKTLDAWNAECAKFISEEKKLPTVETVEQGVSDILIERLSLSLDLREFVRSQFAAQGFLHSKKGPKVAPHSKFENYFDYVESIKSLKEAKNSHRYLALRRGWMEEELTVSLGAAVNDQAVFEGKILERFALLFGYAKTHFLTGFFNKIVKLAYKAHVFPSIETEVHRDLKELADAAAIRVFAENVRNLLLASPFGAKATLGVDPGIRTGCKLAIVNGNGHYVASTVIHPQTPLGQKEAAKVVTSCIEEAKIQAVAVGNGTAGRETETFIRKVLEETGKKDIPVVMVSESGASVYSASETAREEFPELDVTVRGAISIARRFQDPLAELVKIDPKSIGVGQYQHDVAQNNLKKSLEGVVDSCVNFVGVNLNTASYHLLEHVSGIGPVLAKSIVEYRAKNGNFKTRDDLLGVPRFSKKSFEQAAGFLRIPGGANPLDNTGVHPECYPHIVKFVGEKKLTVSELLTSGAELLAQDEGFKKEVGEFTFRDIVEEIKKPGRDPRESFHLFQFREDIHEIKDLKEGLICPGIVTNVTNFGAFVDIGVHQDGLVHISQITDRFVKDPHEVLKPGDQVQVKVVEFSVERKKISLTMKLSESTAQVKAQASRNSERAPQHNRHNPHAQDRSAAQGPSSRSFVSGGARAQSVAHGAPERQNRASRENHGRSQHDDQSRSPRTNQMANRGRSKVDRSKQGYRSARPTSPPQPKRNDFRNNAFGQLADFAHAFGAKNAKKK